MKQTVVGYVLAPVLGLLAMLLPVWLAPPARRHEAPLFPLLRDAVEGVGLPQLALLVVAGIVLGLVSSSRAWWLGLAAIAALPLAAIAEMIVDPSSHNLFPLEFASYAFYGLLVALGVLAIRRVRRARAPPGPASGKAA